MSTKLKNFLPLILLIAITILFTRYFVSNSPNSAVDEEQIAEIVEKVIRENPQVIVDSLQKFYKDDYVNKKDDRQKNLSEIKDKVFNSKLPMVGKADAKKYIIEFFDYNCGYCRKAAQAVDTVINDVADVKVIFIDFPILGKSSEVKAQVSVATALYAKDKYYKVHQILMKTARIDNVDELLNIIKASGVDLSNIKDKIGGNEVKQMIADNRQIASKLGLTGTPAFIINDEIIEGMLPSEELKKKVNN
jgi:protein-disulfide isomerase